MTALEPAGSFDPEEWFVPPPPAAAELAELLSVAAQIEPELIRLVRMELTPRHDVGAEADFWFSDWIGTRTSNLVRLRDEVLPMLRERLAARLARDPADPAWRIWDVILAPVHRYQPVALRLEEELAWTTIRKRAGDQTAPDVEGLLRPALRAVVQERRVGVADWFAAAVPRLPASVTSTVTGWQLLQAATERSTAASFLDRAVLDVSDVYALRGVIPKASLLVRHDGSDLLLNHQDPTGSHLLWVPDTRPRILRLAWEADSGTHNRTVWIEPDQPQEVAVGRHPVRIHTGDGLTYEVRPQPVSAPEPAATSPSGVDWAAVEPVDKAASTRGGVQRTPRGRPRTGSASQPVSAPVTDGATGGKNLTAELQLLHRAAGRPSYRRISSEIRMQNDMPDTVSHETVSAILRGDGVARWSKVECVVRYLAAMAVHRPDVDLEVRRFHTLWLAAADQPFASAALPSDPLADPRTASSPTRQVPAPVMARATSQELQPELQMLHHAAGRPSYRRISSEIRMQNDMPDTVSHETVSAILRGDGVARWSKVECVVRYLAAMAVHRPDVDLEVRRFHTLWLAASDQRSSGKTRSERELEQGPIPVTPNLPDIGPPPTGNLLMGMAPHRNAGFTGRDELLALIGSRLADEPWKPLILYGLGGVGKTQLAIEYAHRHADAYDLVWWIAAEDRSRATAALVALGERQDWPISLDMAQTVATVLGRLERGGARWLLVFDNAGAPQDLASLMPSAGGHVLVTTRDVAWLDTGRSIEVDIFTRRESIELLRARGHNITFDEADQLAERLGDLPLALDQVAAMQSATRTPAQKFRRDLDERAVGLLAAAQPSAYQTTVATAFAVAADYIRGESPAAGQLLELLSCLGTEPINLSLVRSAGASIAPPLGRLISQPDLLDDAVGLLRRYGLVKVLDGGQALQVHRLVQAVVRDTLPEYGRERAFDNARSLLVAANPGSPSDPLTWDSYAQIGPHLRSTRAVETTDVASRQLVLDMATYLYEIGDFDGSRLLSEEAWAAWTRLDDADDVMVYACLRRLAAALHALGRYSESYRLIEEAWGRLRDHHAYGPDHLTTLEITISLAVLHRVFGRYEEALQLDVDCVERYGRLSGENYSGAVSARNDLGASLRALGRFRAAYDIDVELVEARRRWHGEDDQRTLRSVSNLACDLYGLGEYAEALQMQRSIWQSYRDRLGDRHPHVLSAWRTIVLGLRKTGQVAAAVEEGRRLYLTSQGRVGSDHALSLAAMMTYANTLCATGDLSRAWNIAIDAMDRHRRHFGERNPLTLTAAANQAIILRAMGERRRARQVGESSYYALQQVVGQDHPYTIAAAVGVGNDLVLTHEHESARRLLARTLDIARRVRGERHPETLICALNLGLLMGDGSDSTRLESRIDDLRQVLGPEHALVTAAGEGHPAECDIEPPLILSDPWVRET